MQFDIEITKNGFIVFSTKNETTIPNWFVTVAEVNMNMFWVIYLNIMHLFWL